MSENMNSLPFKTAILQVADTGPLESLVVMLRSVGIECLLPGNDVKQELRKIGCDTVLDVESLVKNMGYPRPIVETGTATLADMDRRDVLFVDVKGVRSHPKIVKRWKHLENRVLWYRINGGPPEHVIKADGFDCGDEVNPPCPVLTPNQWYADKWFGRPSDDPPDWCAIDGRAYTCWPPFVRFGDMRRKRWHEYAPPDDLPRDAVCLIHNLHGWGYGDMINRIKPLGVRCFGDRSPDGLVPNHDVPNLLALALANVHLKCSDAPGYAIYETLAAACPLICTQRLIDRCRMQELLIPGKTCLTFDHVQGRDMIGDEFDVAAEEIKGHLERLRDPKESRRIGEAGRNRLNVLQWCDRSEHDKESLRSFLKKNYS